MDVKRRLGLLLAGTVLGTSFLVSAPAFADDAQLQQQINAMQRQLQAMQDQLAETKKQAKAAAQQAQQTQQAQQAQQVQQAQNIPANIPPNLYAADMPIPTKGPPSWFDSIHVSMAGTFIAMEGAFRQRNEVSSGASDPAFSTIPLQNSPLYGENESALQRPAEPHRVEGVGRYRPDPARQGLLRNGLSRRWRRPRTRVRATAIRLRIRQAYFAYDDDNWHGHFSAGQMWSLLTQNRVGILNSTENVPLTIDAQYVAGFNWARQPAIRYVQDVGQIAWFGVSVESPQTNFASNGNGVAGAPDDRYAWGRHSNCVGDAEYGIDGAARALLRIRAPTVTRAACWTTRRIARTTLRQTLSKRSRSIRAGATTRRLGLQRWFTDSVAPAAPPPPSLPSPRARAGARKQISAGASAATCFCPFGRNSSTCRAASSMAKGSAAIARANWLTS